MQQLQELTGFEQVTAPFDGVVTVRNVDTGDLINGTASGGTAMFVLQNDDVLRVHIDVPQAAAVGLVDGLAAKVTLPEMADTVFQGTVARNAAALNTNTRTLPAEVDIKNDAHLLHPGLFVNVTVSVPRSSSDVVVPAGAILFNGEGLRVATIENGEIRIQAQVLGVETQDSIAHGVESARPEQARHDAAVAHLAAFRQGFRHDLLRAARHFLGGAPGKRQHHDACGIDPVQHQVGRSMRERIRLSRSRARQYEHRPRIDALAVERDAKRRRPALRRIQGVECGGRLRFDHEKL